MSLIRSYAIWNNKGGVGKSTITFHLATRYAEKNRNVKVLVIDLCPQSNSSMMLLGGGSKGESDVLALCTSSTPQTVVGYLSTVISSGSGAPLPDYNQYIVDASAYNEYMPDNLFLLCGDGNLEPMSPAISAAAAAPSLTPTSRPWQWVHSVFRALINDIVSKEPEQDLMVFIDTNPSFSIYTELAVSAADRLITPVNADDSSRVAAHAMFILLHGQTPPHPIYGSWTYAALAQSNHVPAPQIHVVVGNRLTQHNGAATAFSALSDATTDALFAAYNSHPSYFTPRSIPVNDATEFKKSYSVALRDFNTAGVVAAHLGRPLSSMTQGYYSVAGQDAKVNTVRITECEDAIDELLTFID